MSTQMKAGPMLRYKKRLFKADWREEYVVLLDDSTLLWYKDKGQPDPDGIMMLAEAPELLAFGRFADKLPKRPELPEGYSFEQLLAFGQKTDFSLQWFLCESSDDVMAWMTAISNTLRTIDPDPDPDPDPEKKDESENSEKSTERKNSTDVNTNPGDTVAIGLAASTSIASPYTFCCGYALGSGWGWFIDTDGISMSSCTSHTEGPPVSPSSHFHEFQGEYLEFDCCDFGADFITF